MSNHQPKCSRLCYLITESLQSHTPTSSSSYEKELLIILTKISREIKSWQAKDEACEEGCGEGGLHDCLGEVVSSLVIFLGNDSKYIQHSSSNVFLVISDYLCNCGKKWDQFHQLLCISLKVSVTKILSSSPKNLIIQAAGSDSNIVDSMSVQEKLPTRASWLTIIGLVRVLRSILKHLKDEDDDEHSEKFVNSIGVCLQNIPWGFISSSPHSGMEFFHHGKLESQNRRFMFLGALLQLLSSVVGVSSFVKAESGSLNEQSIFDTIINLFPKLLNGCFHEEDCSEVHIFQYLRHKTLVLMNRLTSQKQFESSTLFSWLQVLLKYFEDLINLPFSRHQAIIDQCLEGSPFLAHGSGREFPSVHTRHLQCQAIILFLKLSLSLFSVDNDVDSPVPYGTSCSLTGKVHSDQNYCTKTRGLSELSTWIEMHFPMETLTDDEMYLEKCGNFSISFLQLFIDEYVG